MSSTLRLRLRTSTGVRQIAVDADSTFHALRDVCAAAAAIDPATMELLAGFPPKPLHLSASGPISGQLSSGDVLTVRGNNAPTSASIPPSENPRETLKSPTQSSAQQEAPTASHDSITSSGTLVERIVPDDNSCMFRSVAAIVFNDPSMDASELRQICARAVAKDPALYTKDFLQRPNSEYCQWIQRSTAWGGPIELAILSSHFGVELAAFDVKSMHAERYGEGQYSYVGFLVYDGLHYNYLALSRGSGHPDITQFSSNDNTALSMARAIAQQRHDSGSYTDTVTFRLKCMVCGDILRGERAASDHGEKTGHSRFEEI